MKTVLVKNIGIKQKLTFNRGSETSNKFVKTFHLKFKRSSLVNFKMNHISNLKKNDFPSC